MTFDQHDQDTIAALAAAGVDPALIKRVETMAQDADDARVMVGAARQVAKFVWQAFVLSHGLLDTNGPANDRERMGRAITARDLLATFLDRTEEYEPGQPRELQAVTALTREVTDAADQRQNGRHPRCHVCEEHGRDRCTEHGYYPRHTFTPVRYGDGSGLRCADREAEKTLGLAALHEESDPR